MPLELGIFLGAKRFGDKEQKRKSALILDKQQFRYQAAISDIAGQDIRSHDGIPEEAIKCIRNWLRTQSRRKTLPGAQFIISRYRQYESALPQICSELKLLPNELEFNDLWETMVEWQKYAAERER